MTKLTNLLLLPTLLLLSSTTTVLAGPTGPDPNGITPADLPLALPQAAPAAVPKDLFPAPSSEDDAVLEARKYQPLCVCRKNGMCKSKGGWKEYECRNSNCKGKEGAVCNLAANERGIFVAKCPNNELSYEWDWPWKG